MTQGGGGGGGTTEGTDDGEAADSLGSLHCFLPIVGNLISFLKAKYTTLGNCGHCLTSLN